MTDGTGQYRLFSGLIGSGLFRVKTFLWGLSYGIIVEMISLLDRLTPYPIKVFEQAQYPFLWTDVLLQAINDNPHQAILHIWPLEQTVILGLTDKRLPQLTSGLAVLGQAGYVPVIRQMGGLAVVADEGVLNLSLFLPNPPDDQLDIKEAYRLMVLVIEQSLADAGQAIEAYEIEGSYCPGNFDLSIGGKKFAGLAQRRIKQGLVVSIYLSVSGDQTRRGQLIRDFYHQAGGPDLPASYPRVRPETMANLTDLCGLDLSVGQMARRIQEVLARYATSISPYVPSAQDLERLEQALNKEKAHAQD